MRKRGLTPDETYRRRVDACTRASNRAAKAVGLEGGATMEYQGCEYRVPTEVHADAKVVVLMRTGYAPRFPKKVTLTVHGVLWHRLNRKAAICGGGLAASERKFLPDRISQAWLENAIEKAATMLKEACSAEHMSVLRTQALALRRQQCRAGKKWDTTHLKVR